MEFLVDNRAGSLFNISGSDGIGAISSLVRGYFVDVNGDGREDLFVSRNGVNYLYRNNGDKTFTNITSSAVGQLLSGTAASPLGAVFADFDNDNIPDAFVNQRLLLSNGSSFASLNNTNVTNASGLSQVPRMRHLFASDINIDNRTDLFGIAEGGDLTAFLNLGDNNNDDVPEFYDASLDMGLDTIHNVTFLATGDIDAGLAVNGTLSFFPFRNSTAPFVEDEFIDLYVVRNGSNQLLVQLFPEVPAAYPVYNRSSFYVPELIDLSAGSGVDDAGNGTAGIIADFDNNNFADILFGNSDNSSRIVLRSGNSWNISFNPAFSLSINNTKLIQAADWSGDGALDLVYIDASGAIRGSAVSKPSSFVGANPGNYNSEPFPFYSVGSSDFVGSDVFLDHFAEVVCSGGECTVTTKRLPGKGALMIDDGSYTGTDVPIHQPEVPAEPGRGGGGSSSNVNVYGLIVELCPSVETRARPRLLERYWPGFPGLIASDPRTVFVKGNFERIVRAGGEFYKLKFADGVFEYTSPERVECYSFEDSKFRCKLLYFTQVDCLKPEIEEGIVPELPIEEKVAVPPGRVVNVESCVMPAPSCRHFSGVVTSLGIVPGESYDGPVDRVKGSVNLVTSADLVQTDSDRYVNVGVVSNLGLDSGARVEFCKTNSDALLRLPFVFGLPIIDYFVGKFVKPTHAQNIIKKGLEVEPLSAGCAQKIVDGKVVGQMSFVEGKPSWDYFGDYFDWLGDNVIFVESCDDSCAIGSKVKRSPVELGGCEAECAGPGCINGIALENKFIGEDHEVYPVGKASDAICTLKKGAVFDPLWLPDTLADVLSGHVGPIKEFDASMSFSAAPGKLLPSAKIQDGSVFTFEEFDSYCIQKVIDGGIVAQCEADRNGVITVCDGQEIMADGKIYAGRCPAKTCSADGVVVESSVGEKTKVGVKCKRDVCGNGIIDAGEECEPALGDAGCVALYGSGAVCRKDCMCELPKKAFECDYGYPGADLACSEMLGPGALCGMDGLCVAAPVLIQKGNCTRYGCSVLAPAYFDYSGLDVEDRAFVDGLSLRDGLEFVTAPFMLDACDGVVDATVVVTDGFTDLVVLSEAGEIYSSVDNNDLACRGMGWSDLIYSSFVREQPLFEQDVIVESNVTGFSIEGLRVDLDSPCEVVVEDARAPLPGNIDILQLSPAYRIRSDGEMSGTISIEFDDLSGVYPNSLTIFAYDGTKWTPLDSVIEDNCVRASIADYDTYALFGQACDACTSSKLMKVHEGVSDHALILVHGLFNSYKTFMPLIEELRLTGFPYDVWVFDYPGSISFDQASSEFSDLLKAHSQEFDEVVIVAHSLGGLIAEQAVADYKRVRRVIVAGAPHAGSRGLKDIDAVKKFLVNSRAGMYLLGANPDLVRVALEGAFIPRAEGVDYVVMAGTRPYEFSLGDFKITTEAITQIIPNDGVVTVESAQSVGGEMVDDYCSNFFESDWSHSGLIDEPVARKVIARNALLESEASRARPSAGYSKFVRIVDSGAVGKRLIVAGRPVSSDERLSPPNCLCGNGVCGEGEDAVACPVDCAVVRMPLSVCVLMQILAFVLFGVAAVSVFFSGRVASVVFFFSLGIGAACLAVLSISCSVMLWGALIFAVIVAVSKIVLMFKH